jgi:hypothetical protein
MNDAMLKLILDAITESEKRQSDAIHELKTDMSTAIKAVSNPCATCTKTTSLMKQTEFQWWAIGGLYAAAVGLVALLFETGKGK